MIKLLLLSFALIAEGIASAAERASPTFESDYSMNLREACRKSLAGTYLTKLDRSEFLRQYLVLLDQKVARLEQELHKVQARRAEITKKLQASFFDLALLDQDETVRLRENQVAKVLVSLHELQARFVPQARDAEAEVSGLKKGLLTVFNFVPLVGTGLGYPFRMDYQQECPPYRFNCPLSRRYASLLLRILPDKDTPTVCRRYADFLR